LALGKGLVSLALGKAVLYCSRKSSFAESWHSAKVLLLAGPEPATWHPLSRATALGKGDPFAKSLTAGHSAKGTVSGAVWLGHSLPRASLLAKRPFA